MHRGQKKAGQRADEYLVEPKLHCNRIFFWIHESKLVRSAHHELNGRKEVVKVCALVDLISFVEDVHRFVVLIDLELFLAHPTDSVHEKDESSALANSLTLVKSLYDQ